MSEENKKQEEIKDQVEEQTTKGEQETDTAQEDKNSENSENTSKEESPEDKYNELNDKYLRLYSEFDNYRKRTNKEKIDLISTANASLMKDLLSTLDDFERAMKNNESTDDVSVLKEGFSLIFNKYKSTLESKGLKVMETIGTEFDSELHEAVANIPAPEEKLKGKIVDDVEKGYYLNDKVIRYAKVVVGQ